MTDQALSKKLPLFASQMRWPEVIPAKKMLQPPSREEIIATMADQPLLTEGLPASVGSISNRQPTSREWMVDIIRRRLYSDDREGQKYANRVMNVLDFSPVGIANQFYDAGRALGEGRFKDAATEGGLAFLPALRKSPAGLFNPIPKSPRSVVNDYPNGTELNDEDYITHDMEGRPLDALYVAGRTRLDEPDHALTPIDIQRVGEYGIQGPINKNSRDYFDGGVLGETWTFNGKPEYVHIVDDLPPAETNIVTAHEVAHVIDELAGKIPTKQLDKELNFVYNALGTGRERKYIQSRPADFGYSRTEDPREKMAEAIRAYMVDPNYLKTVAPKTAAAIRAAVNSNPKLNKIIQFNSIAPVGLGAAAMTAQSNESETQKGPPNSSWPTTVPYSGSANPNTNQVIRGVMPGGLSSRRPSRPDLEPIVRALFQAKTSYGGPR